MNYCPLAFLAEGRNITPDKISAKEAKPLFSACDEHLLVMIKALKPEWMIGVGAWAEERAAHGAPFRANPPSESGESGGEQRLGRNRAAAARGARRLVTVRV